MLYGLLDEKLEALFQSKFFIFIKLQLFGDSHSITKQKESILAHLILSILVQLLFLVLKHLFIFFD